MPLDFGPENIITLWFLCFTMKKKTDEYLDIQGIQSLTDNLIK